MGCKISRRDGGNDGVPNLKTPSSSVVGVSVVHSHLVFKEVACEICVSHNQEKPLASG